jgi:hypothetical protein
MRADSTMALKTLLVAMTARWKTAERHRPAQRVTSGPLARQEMGSAPGCTIPPQMAISAARHQRPARRTAHARNALDDGLLRLRVVAPVDGPNLALAVAERRERRLRSLEVPDLDGAAGASSL